MLTYKLWLKKDKDLPCFKRLCFNKVEVPFVKLIKESIHPHGALIEDHMNRSSVIEKIVSVINEEKYLLKELAEFEYSYPLNVQACYAYYNHESGMDDRLNRIRNSIYFVEELKYPELLKIVRQRIAKIWSHDIATALTQISYPCFCDLRNFLKAKDKSIKLSGCNDINKYDLGKMLFPDDFLDKEKAIISQALPILNFRKCSVIESITTSEGYLSLTEEITNFSIALLEKEPGKEKLSEKLTYHCTRQGDIIQLIPDISDDSKKRRLARSISSKWAKDAGRYCFKIILKELEQMRKQLNLRIKFPSLNYKDECLPSVSCAKLQENKLEAFSIGSFTNEDSTNKQIVNHLREYGKKVTGKKETLIERLAELSSEIYKKEEVNLDEFFSNNRFIRVPESNSNDNFNITLNTTLKNILLAMYILKHLYGNTILEAQHVNKSFKPVEAARALLNKDITVAGSFIRVEF